MEVAETQIMEKIEEAPSDRRRRIFGAHLKRVRKLRKMTQEGLAEAADLHKNTVTQLERGETWVGDEVLAKIAGSLRVEVGALFTEEAVRVMPTPKEALKIIENAVEMAEKIAELSEAKRELIERILSPSLDNAEAERLLSRLKVLRGSLPPSQEKLEDSSSGKHKKPDAR